MSVEENRHHKSNDYKKCAVEHYLTSGKTQETCKIFKCSVRSLMRWVDRYKDKGEVKEVVNRDNHLLYSVPYQHFTNAIENYFSVFKSKLQKLDGLTYEEIKANIRRAIRSISKTTYKNILSGSYERDGLYVKKSTKKSNRKYKIYKD
jgi:hypothetical protein